MEMIGLFLHTKMCYTHFRITHLVFGVIILATIIFYSTLNSRQFDIETKRYHESRHNDTEKFLVPLLANVTHSRKNVQSKIIRRKNCGFFTYLANGCGLPNNISNVFQRLGEASLLTNESTIKIEANSNYIQKIMKLSESQENLSKKRKKIPRNHSTPNETDIPKIVESTVERVVKTKDIYEKGHVNDIGTITNICPDKGSDVNLLILVTSAPTHREQRLSIRQSWGHYGIRRDISIGFVLGRTQDQRIADQLSAENYMYSDLIRGNFVDSYSNLTLKSISLLEWTSINCPNATYLLKTDDDMFINVPKLLQFIETHLTYRRSIFGRLAKKWKPIRNKKSKYYVSPEQYFPPVFPPFTTAAGIILGPESKDAFVFSIAERTISSSMTNSSMLKMSEGTSRTAL
ncbi:beta-1,3-galactosyltransferase 2-like isoform X3 [Topomyia yanbarensis]|uniref:beta-1,3-galactosyltransferase 2-like isoform X3 n=1 Tax=Topomyia yanbarensis TaxID=2498891 RepID=UPI00273C2FB5|nr:beta-1,3-galactosyltransferase 2-like isoform X3 [Topomyia yanbarensis]